MCDDRAYVEAGLEQDGHLVPGFIHLTAVDPFERKHIENDFVPVDGDFSRGDSEDRDAPSVAMLLSMSRKAAGLPDISIPTSKPSFMPSFFWTSLREVS